MCLTITTTEKPKGKIATRDIICYKVLEVVNEGKSDAKAISPYRGFRYEFGKRYESKIDLDGTPGNWEIDAGLHSLVSFEAAEEECGNYPHYYIFVAVIPKGSRYWQGDFNIAGDSYASDALIVLSRDSARSKQYIRNLPPR